MVISKGLRQAYEVQDLMHGALMALGETLKVEGKLRAPDKETAQALGTLEKSWKDAQEQIRVHKGKPLPGSLTHDKVRAGRAQRRLPTSVLADLATQVDEAEQPTPGEPTPGADQGHDPTTIGSSNV